MLSNYQVEYLAKKAELKVHWLDNNTPIGIGRGSDDIVCYPYEDFKLGMGLEDIRFHWLLGDNNFIAGGSVLNWVWQESKNEDTDFFFKTPESSETFMLFLESVGVKKTKETGYAKTLFDSDSNAIIQVVGNRNLENNDTGAFYGDVYHILKRFDIELCKFAVDIDNVYFTRRAIQNLISLQLEATDFLESKSIYRIEKYLRKGFYPGFTIKQGLKYDKQKQSSFPF